MNVDPRRAAETALRDGCVICGLSPRTGPRRLPGLQVWRCRSCGHRVAAHERSSASAVDYHRQYHEGAFLDALAATRRRQAVRIVSLLRRHLATVSGVADYGAGRGFFLAACRDVGVGPLAGLDTSPLAVEALRSQGIEAHLLGEDENPQPALDHLSFRPRVLSFLDVVEHFPPREMAARVRGAVAGAGDALELLVIKVPVPGLLYACATFASRLGAHGPLRQLYQAGTWPPHFSYFTIASLRRLLTECGLSVVEAVGDPDFEAGTLPDRTTARTATARRVALFGGHLIAATVRWSGWFDSVIVVARPMPPPR